MQNPVMICQILQDCFDDEHSATVISKVGALSRWFIDGLAGPVRLGEATNGFWGLAAWLHERSGEYGKALDCRLQDTEWTKGQLNCC